VKLLSVPAGEDGLPEAFGMPGIATVMRRPPSKEGDHKNIVATTVVDLCAPTTLPPASIRYDAPQAIDSQYVSHLQTGRHAASLSRSGVFRTRTRTRSWRDRDVQQSESFVWSPTRPANRRCLRRRSPIHASSIWSGCWRDRPRGTSFKPKQTTGRETASRSNEVAS
jgi:hypothetical protein